MVYRERSEVERIQLEQSIKERPEYDLSLVPYFKKEPVRGKVIYDIIEKKNPVLFKRVNVSIIFKI